MNTLSECMLNPPTTHWGETVMECISACWFAKLGHFWSSAYKFKQLPTEHLNDLSVESVSTVSPTDM